MLKKIKYSLIIAGFAGLLLQSCKKEEILELAPDFQLDASNNPSNLSQVEGVLLGSYSLLRGANYFGSGSGTGGGWAMMPDVLSDNLYETQTTLANSRAMADWLYQPNTGQIATFYSAPYQVIAAANIVINRVDEFATAANQATVNDYKGQALVIRAMAHFDLFRYFAPSYDRNSTSDLALYYSKEFSQLTNETPSQARISNKEYYDNMLADLQDAIALLEPRAASGVTRPYIDLAAAYAIQARVYLYAEMWEEAAEAASNAIDIRPLPALSFDGFAGMYDQTAIGDMIWNVQFEAGQSGPTFLVFFATNDRSYFRPAPEVATADGDEGLIQSNDVRYDAFFRSTEDGLEVFKYSGKNGVQNGNANFIAIRTGEMYLIRAEAYARQGFDELGMADLNALRAARIEGYEDEALTGAALLEAIANERRRELFAEGHRFFDVKRTTRTLMRGAICGTDESVAGDCELMPADREWTLPIPEGIMNANPNMVQNPNY